MRLDEAKKARKKLEEDARLLANRIALLENEEKKALKKIQETKKKAEEITTLKKRNKEITTQKQSVQYCFLFFREKRIFFNMRTKKTF